MASAMVLAFDLAMVLTSWFTLPDFALGFHVTVWHIDVIAV